MEESNVNQENYFVNYINYNNELDDSDKISVCYKCYNYIYPEDKYYFIKCGHKYHKNCWSKFDIRVKGCIQCKIFPPQ